MLPTLSPQGDPKPPCEGSETVLSRKPNALSPPAACTKYVTSDSSGSAAVQVSLLLRLNSMLLLVRDSRGLRLQRERYAAALVQVLISRSPSTELKIRRALYANL